jgi:hypothetical protein
MCSFFRPATFFHSILKEVYKDKLVDKFWMQIDDYKNVDSFDEMVEKRKKQVEGFDIKVDDAAMLNSFCIFSCIPEKILSIFSPVQEPFFVGFDAEGKPKYAGEEWIDGTRRSKDKILLLIKKFYEQFFKELHNMKVNQLNKT